ncbi:MAG: AAA family ATPase [Betaproteobacteria bacterium]|jgi:nicotinamide riboside kinase|nr:ATP-binding protein [Rubrivivax sp.]
MAEAGRCIAIVGAESTGKTTLAAALAERLRRGGHGRVAWVPEVLREWCDAQGRTPRAHEQDAILRAQHERIAEAAATHDWVVCDTTALMTAVYSTLVFGDEGLQARAAALHARSAAVTLLTALDLPWVADGHQRDGPQVREPVDTLLRTLMRRHGLAFSVVAGQGEQRVQRAFDAVRPLLKAAPAGGLFTGLAAGRPAPRRWACECCVPEAERALLAARLAP